MIFGWSNYDKAVTNVTPELKQAMSTWSLDQFHYFRCIITKAWWKSFFKGQWLLIVMMIVMMIVGLAAAFSGAGDGAATMFAVSTMSVGVSFWNFVRALLRDRANLLHTYRQAAAVKHYTRNFKHQVSAGKSGKAKSVPTQGLPTPASFR